MSAHVVPIRFSADHIYVHVPVCRKRCDYCDFFTRTSVAGPRQLQLIRRIDEQIEATWAPIEGHPPGVVPGTFYVGGGTPSALAPVAWDALLQTITRWSSPAGEVTIEVNPEDMTARRCRELRDAGVNRVSVGVQTFSERALRTIGRHTTSIDTRKGLDTIASEWDGRWSADIIVAIPGEGVVTVERDLETILSYSPRHLSVYELGIEAGTVLAHRLRRRPLKGTETDEDETLRHLDFAETFLAAAGLRRYEVSSYAIPGQESQHNLAYWRMRPHLGVGPGAVGTLALPERDANRAPRYARVSVPGSFQRYMDNDFGLTVEPLGTRDFAAEYCMMGLRTIEGIDRSRFRSITGVAFRDICAPAIKRWPGAFTDGVVFDDRRGISQTDGPRVALAAGSWNVMDSILTDIFRDLDSLGNS